LQVLPPTPESEVRVGPEGVIAAHSGELCFAEEDMVLPSRGGLGFRFRRYYRSFSEYDGPMGHGWDHNHNIRIVADAPSLSDAKTLRLHGGDFDVQFLRDGQRWAVQRGAFLSVEVQPQDMLVVTDAQRNQWTFELAASSPQDHACWRLQRQQTRHGPTAGNNLIYRYVSGTDVLASVEDPFGQLVRFYYDGAGRLRLLAGPGMRAEFSYDQHGSLISATIPRVAVSLSESAASSMEYGYRRAAGRAWCTSRRLNHSDSALFADIDLEPDSSSFGQAKTAGYRLIAKPAERITWSFAHVAADERLHVTVTPPVPGPVIVYSFAVKAPFPWLPTEMAVPARRASWNYLYNDDGLCTRETHPEGYQVLRRYDADSVDARSRRNCLDERTETTATPLLGPLTAKGRTAEFLPGTAFPVCVSAYQIDASGERRVLLEERYEYRGNTFDLLKAVVGDESTSYFWNPRGQILGEVDGCGAVTLFYYLPGIPEHDMESFVDGVPEGGGVLVRMVEDAPITELARVGTPEDRKRVAELPRRFSPIPPSAEVTHFLHDQLGRKIGQAGPGHQVFAVVNRLGHELAAWDSSGGLTVTEYDQRLLRRRVFHRLSPSFRSATDTGYTGSGIEPFDGRFYMESYAHDAWDRVASFSPTDEPARQGATRPEFRYERYPSGALHRLTDPVGTVRIHEYDANTGLPRRIGLDGSDGEAMTLQTFLEYSPSGLLLSFQDDCEDVWTVQLDSLGRAFEEHQPDGVISRTSLDGLDRPTRMVASREGQVVDDQEWEYTSSGRTARITRLRLRQADGGKVTSVGKMVVEENRYGPSGQLAAQRGPRADAWRQIFYDGIGRPVAEKSPENNWTLAAYRDGSVVVRSAMMRKPDADGLVALREVTILTERFRPYVTMPVDSAGVPQWARASVQQWSPEGRLLETLEPDSLHTQVAYDTRGNRLKELVRPVGPHGKGEQQHRTWRYNAAGRQVAQITDVTPLALFRKGETEKTVVPRRVSVPQVIEWRYDSLGRLVRQDHPDGLQVTRQYGRGGGMVTRMTWRHLTRPSLVLRDLEFRYGPKRRLVAVLRSGEERPVQEFNYDAWGFCARSTDRTGPDDVVVRREFDNWGLQWLEQIGCGPVRLQDLAMEDNPEAGSRRLRWQHPNAMPAMFWTEACYQRDRDDRVSSLLLDGRDFSEWAYQGQMPVSRTVAPSRTRRILSLSSMGEVVGLRIEAQDGKAWVALSDMRYALDARGSVIASTVRLGGVLAQPESIVSQYTDLDAYRQIIASAQEPVAWPDLAARHRELLASGDSPGAVLASRIHRDQAGNMLARYQGRWTDSALETALDRGTLYSSGPAISLPQTEDQQADVARLVSMLAESDRLQLASNRLTATAQQGHEQQNYKYDLLGQLSEYAGSYWDGKKARPVFWSLTFDSLGRLTRMKAVARDPAKDTPSDNAATVADLEYMYDAANRRVVKRVMDHATNRVHREATLYCDGRQTMVLEQHGDGSWVPIQQYVWGASPAEALQVVTSAHSAGTGNSRQLECYALHQDRGMDVVFATSIVGGRVQATPLATYLDTGENASSTRVAAIRSSSQATDPEACRNGRVDDGRQTRMLAQGEWNWVELQLPEARLVSGLTIWTDAFPNDFEVYRLDPGQQLPAGDEVDTWTRRAKQEGRLLAAAVNGMFLSPTGLRRKLSLMECPYQLVMNGSRVERFVILWRNESDRSPQVSVSEFSVQVLPEAISALGQNGAWLDRETGLYYQHHRYRLPAMNGKFISPDPLGFLGGPDLYAYANNNPLHWHDPDGRFAHILWGAGIGAVFGGGSYLVECWISGEEISWSRLAIRTATGAATGAVAALTFGAGSSFLAAKGFSSLANAVLTGSMTGGVAGFAGGFLSTSAEGMLLDGRGIGDALLMGLAAGGRGAAIGVVGGAAGGAVFSQVGATFLGSVVSGASGGAAGGGVAGAWQGYQRHGLSLSMLHYAGSGALRGAAYGAAGGAAGWAAGRASGVIRPMKDYPGNLPKPGGLLVRTQPGQRTYGDMPVQPGAARHHVTPLSLGGRDVPSNIEYVPMGQHRTPHPPTSVRDAPMGTIFY